ncbi:MAG: N-acetylneuraminate synthase [Candidatus Epulonipiscioides saccharophilum]|nr:MAG: N-acetylneuraminate synthase [Epulopiscium sp. AS2M-Bin001]
MFIIAEAGVNHNGNISIAKQLIDMAKRCGADAVKFQTFKAEDVVDSHESKVGYQKLNDTTVETQFQMLKRLELSYDQFLELKNYCDQIDIMFLSTPFSIEAMEFLMDIDMQIIKLSSTEVTNLPFLEKVASFNKPVILSTGMSYFDEIVTATDTLKNYGGHDITLLHCTTNYPTSLVDANLLAMDKLKALSSKVGFSDHTASSLCAIIATSRGACTIEKHITLDRNMPGPDHKASADENEFKKYVAQIRNVEIALGDGLKVPTKSEYIMRDKVRRSIVAKIDIPKGIVIDSSMLTFRRPATGISPVFYNNILGNKAAVDIKKDTFIEAFQIENFH